MQAEAAAQQALLTTAFTGEVSFSQMLMDLSRTIPSDAYLDSFNAALIIQVAGRCPTTPTTTFVGSFTASGGGRRLREPGELVDAAGVRQGLGEPVALERDRDRANTGLYTFSSGVDLSQDALTARGRAGEPSGG